MLSEEQRQVLREVYAYLLSLPDPEEDEHTCRESGDLYDDETQTGEEHALESDSSPAADQPAEAGDIRSITND